MKGLKLLPFVYLKMLCEAGCNKDFANKYGVTPLAEAVQKGTLAPLLLLETMSVCHVQYCLYL